MAPARAGVFGSPIPPSPLETAGAFHRALPLLGAAPFMVINGDIWSDYPLARLLQQRDLAPGRAHLVLVDNPPQHPDGDFCLDSHGAVRPRPAAQAGLTYAGIGVYTPEFFADMTAGKLPLRPLLDAAIAAKRLRGEHYTGTWEDVGTHQRLRELDARLRGADLSGPAG